MLVESFKHKQKIKKSWVCIYLLHYRNQIFLTSEIMRLRSFKELIYIWYYFIDLLTYSLSLPDACCGWIDATEVFLSLHIVLRKKIKFTFKVFCKRKLQAKLLSCAWNTLTWFIWRRIMQQSSLPIKCDYKFQML